MITQPACGSQKVGSEVWSQPQDRTNGVCWRQEGALGGLSAVKPQPLTLWNWFDKQLVITASSRKKNNKLIDSFCLEMRPIESGKIGVIS